MKKDFTKYKQVLSNLTPSSEFPEFIQVGKLDGNIPFIIPTRNTNGICFYASQSCYVGINTQIEQVIFQLMLKTQEKLLKVSILDIGFGSSFPNLKRLDKQNVPINMMAENGKASIFLKEMLEDARRLNDTLLETGFENVNEYNKTAAIKEPYHFIVLTHFPTEFSNDDAKYLYYLLQNASRLGYFFVVNFNTDALPESKSYSPEKYETHQKIVSFLPTIEIDKQGKKAFQRLTPVFANFLTNRSFDFEVFEKSEINKAIEILNARFSKKDTSVYQDFLSIPIGYDRHKRVYFEMGEKSANNHVLVGGGSRMGKSTFLNNFIVQIAENYSPDDIRLFLVDFKSGVEFKKYTEHPNVEYLLLENENFANTLKVLQVFADEIKIRADLFDTVAAHINNIDLYNAEASNKLCRKLLIIDEAQVLFQSGFKEKNAANALLNKIMRQGGAFGLLVVLCTQTFQGVGIDNDAKSQANMRMAFRMATSMDCSFIGISDKATQLNKGQIILKNMQGEATVMLDNIEANTIQQRLEMAKQKFFIQNPIKMTILRA